MAVDSMGMQEYIPFTEGSIEALSCSGFHLTQTQFRQCINSVHVCLSHQIPVGLGVGVGAGEEVGAMLVAGVEAGEEHNTWHRSAQL